ncbi:MAG: HlyD family secretion protein [Anaerolineae bacterium]
MQLNLRKLMETLSFPAFEHTVFGAPALGRGIDEASIRPVLHEAKRQTGLRGALFGLLTLVFLAIMTHCTPEPPPTPIITPLPTNQVGDVRASGTVVPAQQVQLSFAMLGSASGLGRVDEVTVAVGDTVEEGQLLIRLDATDLEANVARAEAALIVAQRERARLDAPPDADAVAAAEADVRAAEAAVTQTLLSRSAPSVGVTEAETSSARAAVAAAMADRREAFEIHEDTLTCVELEGYGEICPALGPPEQNARFAWQAAEARLDAAEAQMNALEPRGLAEVRVADANLALAEAQQDLAEAQLAQAAAPAMEEEIAVADAAVAEARAAVDAAKAALRYATLEASMDGTVVDVGVEVGEVVRAGQPAITLADLENLRVETTDLSELDVARVKPGQTVMVLIEALDDRQIQGVVQRIAQRPELLGGDVVYTVIVDLDPIPTELRMGMSVEVTIHVE